MNKFRVGDKVIVINGAWYTDDYYPVKYGQEAVVHQLHSTNTRLYYIAPFHTSGVYEEEHLEFADIYNTPLYRAMRE